MPDINAIGRSIARLRQARRMTQQELASLMYVSHQAVSKWEHGVALPDVITLYRLSRIFGVTMEQLITAETTDRVPELA